MRKKALALGLLLLSLTATATDYDSLTKTASIVYFRVQYVSLGIPDSALVEPVHKQLNRLFRLGEIIDLEEPPVNYVGRYGKVPPKKKLKPEAIEAVDRLAPRTDLIVVVRVEHAYNGILGGLIGGRRHVMWVRYAVFDRTGKLVAYKKKKSSCCSTITFNSNGDDLPEEMMDATSFLNLYLEVLVKLFPG